MKTVIISFFVEVSKADKFREGSSVYIEKLEISRVLILTLINI